jgi:hypothetical protein
MPEQRVSSQGTVAPVGATTGRREVATALPICCARWELAAAWVGPTVLETILPFEFLIATVAPGPTVRMSSWVRVRLVSNRAGLEGVLTRTSFQTGVTLTSVTMTKFTS